VAKNNLLAFVVSPPALNVRDIDPESVPVPEPFFQVAVLYPL
jgi:hypothetical protein